MTEPGSGPADRRSAVALVDSDRPNPGSTDALEADAPAGPPRPLPVRRLLQLALAGSAVVLALVLVDVSRYGGNPVSLVQPGTKGPSAAVFARDFPDTQLPDSLGHDGQQFYAIARQPMHVDRVSADLDRPQYRLQRPLLPWLAWAVHPSGGGVGLIYGFLLVGFGAMVLGGVSLGAISVTLGGRSWPALAFPLLPGCYVCLRISVADTLSVALALLAIALALRSRWRGAIVAAVLAVLAKEVAIVLLLGYALWRRDRRSAALVAVPLGAVAAWWAALHILLPHGGGRIDELVAPFVGLARSVAMWADGEELSGMVAVVLTVGVAVALLVRRGRSHPFALAIALQLAFVCVLGKNVVGPNLNGPRATLALAALAVLLLAVPEPRSNRRSPLESHPAGRVNGDGGPAGDPGSPGAQPPQHLARPAP
jgi:hypothetical protein